ncbi:MAG: creatininase family protein [Armatimonadetes bacterium]|nr:creatininase family protein [Armatimonadota bacterium]
MRLGDMSFREVEEVVARGVSAILPLGSIEEHGPHAPMGDYAIIDGIAGRTAEHTGDVVAPTIPFGYSEYFRNYAGTITVRPSTLDALMQDAVDCLLSAGFRRIVIFNGHNGNTPIVELFTRRVRRERGLVIPSLAPLQVIQNPDFVKEVYGGPVSLGHGGEPVGSIMMHLKPGTVKLQRAEDFGKREVYGLPMDGLSALRFKGVRVAFPLDMEDVTPPSGSQSDPRLASAERGEKFITYAVKFCTDFMQWFRTVDPWMKKP